MQVQVSALCKRTILPHFAALNIRELETALDRAKDTLDSDNCPVLQMLFLKYARDSTVDLLKKLLIDSRSKGKINVDERDESGNTALHLAVQNRNSDLVKVLFNGGAKLTLKDNQGKTAKWYALEHQRECTEKLALNKGKKGNDPYTNTPYKGERLKAAKQLKVAQSIIREFECFERKIFAALALCRSKTRPNNPLPRDIALRIIPMI